MSGQSEDSYCGNVTSELVLFYSLRNRQQIFVKSKSRTLIK
jgi:hypothetical protein